MQVKGAPEMGPGVVQAYFAQGFISATLFGTSMPTHHILRR